MKKLRVCIIGKGYGLKILFPIFDSYKNVNIVGLSSKTIKKNDVLKIKRPLTTFSSWKRMILECFPDLVVVATPPYEQSKIIFFLIKIKIPFFAEKPLTHNFISAKKIFLAIKKINLPAVIDFNFISLPIFSDFRRQMIEKKIGKIINYKFNWNFKPLSKNKNINTWKYDIKKGGGTINIYGSHVFSIIEFLFGTTIKLKNVLKKDNYCKKYNTKLNYENVNIITLHKKKIKGNISINPNSSKKSLLEIIVYGSKKTIQIINLSKDYHSNYKIFSNNNNSSNKLISSYFNKTKKDSRLIASKYIANDLINSMVKRKKPKYDLLKAFNVQKLINAFLVSKRHKREIKILK